VPVTQNSVNERRIGKACSQQWMRSVWVVMVIGVGLVAAMSLRQLALTSAGRESAYAAAGESSATYLYRLDPDTSSFITIPLPLASHPADVQVVSDILCQQIWFSEPGLRRIGRVVYTSSLDYKLDEFDIGAAPQALAASDTAVWFTLPEQNQVGRLEVASGAVALFDLPTAQADPAGIALASPDQVWVAERAGNRLAFATISPTMYITEYVPPASDLMPEGITLDDGGNVWFAAGGTDTIWRLTPANGEYLTFPLEAGSHPYRFAWNNSNDLWTTLQNANQLAQIVVGTSPYATMYTVTTPNSLPGAIGIDSHDRVSFAEQALAQVGQLVVTPTPSFTEYPLPQPDLKLTGLAVGGDDAVWAIAYRDALVYLPLVAHDYDPLMYKIRLPIVMRDYDATLPPFGVQMYGSVNSAGFPQMVQAGVKWVRIPVSWSEIEPVNTTPGNYQWASTDMSVQTATDSGVHLIMYIDSNPTWAAQWPSGPVHDPADLQEFVHALVARYSQVDYWEFYNEPDSLYRFALNGAGYAAMLQSVYPVVKSANPNAQVVMGGLALDWFIDMNGTFDRHFLRDVLQNCSGPCFDVANFHYYPYWRATWESYGHDVIGKAAYVRQQLATYGYSRPIICTEASWASGGVNWGSVELQARYVPKLYVRGFAAGLPVVNWFAWIDTDSTYSGLLGPGLVPRPSYTAYQTLTSLMSQARYVRSIPPSETGSTRVEGYQFSVPGLGERKRLDVYWYECPTMASSRPPKDCGDTASLAIRASRIAKIDKLGGRVILNDAADGRTDGRVTIPGGVGSSPIYIDYEP
jgi:streptogramin lyase